VTLYPVPRLRPWKPSEYITCHDTRPPVPCLIAIDRKPWRLIDIQEVPTSSWKKEDWEEHERRFLWKRQRGEPFPSPDEWDARPIDLIVAEVKGGKEYVSRARPWGYRLHGWLVLPEHHAVCGSCGELAPCREYEREQLENWLAAQAREKFEKDLAKMPGCCWSCGEVITHRQKSIAFEGENADLPGGPSAIFHLRQKCRAEARAYEERWAKLDPRRRPRLSCSGNMIIHVDGIECTEGPMCPGGDARHTSYLNHKYDMGICLRCKDAAAMGP
jgi:hypothetical protein